MRTRKTTDAERATYEALRADTNSELGQLSAKISASAKAFYGNGSNFETEAAFQEHRRLAKALDAEMARLGFVITDLGLRVIKA